MTVRTPTVIGLLILLTAGGCTQQAPPVVETKLSALSEQAYSLSETDTSSVNMAGFVEFDERVEIAAESDYGSCFSATYEFRFEYDTSVFVEFRDGTIGNCSYGAVMTSAFGTRVLAEEDFPIGTQLLPFIQFHQSDPHLAVFQIGREYFMSKASDLRAVEISCRRGTCDGSVLRRRAGTI